MIDIRVGDTLTVGPFIAKLSDGTRIPLGTVGAVTAKVWCGLSTSRTAAAIVTKKNAVCTGGSDAQVEVTDPVNGEFYVYFLAADTDDLLHDTKYYLDARIKLQTGEVYTVGEASFRALDPYSATAAPA